MIPHRPVSPDARTAIPALSRAALAAGLSLFWLAPGLAAQSSEAPESGSPAAPAGEVGPGAGPAEGRGGEPDRIDGFWGLPWHADSATVAGKLGPPITAGRQGPGLRMFVYTPLYLGRDGFLQLWIHEERGLVAGTWEPMTSDCSDMLRRLVRETKQVHPGVPHRTEGAVRREMLGRDICVAAMEEGASVTVVWEDPAGTRIAIGTTPESHKLRMRATTAVARELRESR